MLGVRDDFPAPATRLIGDRTGDGSNQPTGVGRGAVLRHMFGVRMKIAAFPAPFSIGSLTDATAGVVTQALGERVQLVGCGWLLQVRDEEQRAVGARPEALADQVVRLPGGRAGGVVAGVRETRRSPVAGAASRSRTAVPAIAARLPRAAAALRRSGSGATTG